MGCAAGRQCTCCSGTSATPPYFIKRRLIRARPQTAFSPSDTTFLEAISPDPSSKSLISAGSLSISLTPPPAPLTGLLSLVPAYGERVDLHAVEEKYRSAVKALSDRLGEDTWILGSAYVYCICILPQRY